jgi:hypothetical protein
MEFIEVLFDIIQYYLYIVPLCVYKCLTSDRHAKIYNFLDFYFNPKLLCLKILQLYQIIEDNEVDAISVIGGLYELVAGVCLFKNRERIGTCSIYKHSLDIGKFIKYSSEYKIYCGNLVFL